MRSSQKKSIIDEPKVHTDEDGGRAIGRQFLSALPRLSDRAACTCAQIDARHYSNDSECVRDLNRREPERSAELDGRGFKPFSSFT